MKTVLPPGKERFAAGLLESLLKNAPDGPRPPEIFVVMRWGTGQGDFCSTSFRQDSYHGQWTDVFRVRATSATRIQLQVIDKDLSEDDPMGSTSFSIQSVLDAGGLYQTGSFGDMVGCTVEIVEVGD